MEMHFEHKTHFLDVAADYLGLEEVTPVEYEHLTKDEQKYTQMAMIKNYGDPSHQWCAHTVSTLCNLAGIDIGRHKASVFRAAGNNFVDWARERNAWKPLNTYNLTNENYETNLDRREIEIKKQLSQIHEGDFCIWASKFAVKVDGENSRIEKQASHIGIFEYINLKEGYVIIIEGNANISERNDYYDRKIASTPSEAKRGDQDLGDFTEINMRDGLIRKKYTIKDLAKYGYSGFIDNKNIIK